MKDISVNKIFRTFGFITKQILLIVSSFECVKKLNQKTKKEILITRDVLRNNRKVLQII